VESTVGRTVRALTDTKFQSALRLLAVLLGLSLAACAKGTSPADGRLAVVATTTQIGDMAANVGGDRIALTVLLKANQDAHDFEPAPSQIRKLHAAKVILRNGIGLDVYVNKLAGGDLSRVAIVTEGVPLRTAEGTEEEAHTAAAAEASGHDPHVWLSVPNAMIMVGNIRDALASADPANAGYYEQNAAAYIARLQALDLAIRAQVAQVPEQCRRLVTNHDTLGYSAAEYGFTVVGSVIPSISSEAQPSASNVGDIVDKIRAEHVPAIFAETSLNPALIRQVGREAGVTVVDDLYGDSLGPKGSGASTYIEMMEWNTTRIVEALRGCDVP
jgi:zinc/manganese transport system substrate-binding protein